MAVELVRRETAKRPRDPDLLVTCKQELYEVSEVPKRIKLEVTEKEVPPEQANFIKLPETSGKTNVQFRKLPPLPPNIAVKREPEEAPAPETNNSNCSFETAAELVQPASLIKQETSDDRLPSPVNSNTSSSTAFSEQHKSIHSSSSTSGKLSTPPPKLQLVCPSCPAKLESWCELIRHCSTFHKAKPDIVLHKCDLCHKVFHYRKSLISHQKTHKTTWVPCPLCDRKFKNDIDKNRHYKEIHGDPPKYKCLICGDLFRTPGSIFDHAQDEHRTPKAALARTTRSKRRSGISSGKNTLGTTGSRRLETPSHEDPDLTWTCEDCGQEFTLESSLMRHCRRRRVDPLACEVCGKVFCYETGFLKHMKEHQHQSSMELSPGVCSKCSKEDCICERVNLNNNEVQVPVPRAPVSGMEPQERRRSPQRPRRGFSARRTINVMKLQRFSCDDCGGSFKTKTILQVHRRTHTGEKPFACTVCGKRFSNSGSFSYHKKHCHNEV